MAKEAKWNGRYKGDGWAAKVLERIYGNKRLSIFAPLGVGTVVFVLFLLFGENTDKAVLARDSLIFAAVEYAAMLLVLGFQLWNPVSTPRIMDFGVLFFTVGVALGALMLLPGFLFDMKQGYFVSCVASCTAISAIALIQSFRR